MNRRKFLQRVAGVGAVAVTGAADAIETAIQLHDSKALRSSTKGLGLASAKPEGAEIEYDPIDEPWSMDLQQAALEDLDIEHSGIVEEPDLGSLKRMVYGA